MSDEERGSLIWAVMIPMGTSILSDGMVWWQVVVFFWLVFCVFGALFCHEMSHYLAGILCRLPVTRVVIGAGPTIVKFTFRGVGFYFRPFPISGRVQYGWASTNFFKRSALNLSGPLANVCLFALGMLIGDAYILFANSIFLASSLNPMVQGGDMNLFVDDFKKWRAERKEHQPKTA